MIPEQGLLQAECARRCGGTLLDLGMHNQVFSAASFVDAAPLAAAVSALRGRYQTQYMRALRFDVCWCQRDVATYAGERADIVGGR